MPFHIGTGGLGQAPLPVSLESSRYGRPFRIENLDAGGLQHAESLRSAMAGDQSLGAGAGDGFRRLDAGSLGRVEVLSIVHDFEGFAVQVVDDKFGRSAEAGIQGASSLLPGVEKAIFTVFYSFAVCAFEKGRMGAVQPDPPPNTNG
jgi:hypothetical protein